jgi:hypothetical protein
VAQPYAFILSFKLSWPNWREYSGIRSTETDDAAKYFSPSRGSNSVPPEYESEALSFESSLPVPSCQITEYIQGQQNILKARKYDNCVSGNLQYRKGPQGCHGSLGKGTKEARNLRNKKIVEINFWSAVYFS